MYRSPKHPTGPTARIPSAPSAFKLRLALCVLGLLSVRPGLAQAGDAVRLEVVADGVIGGAPPALIVHPQVGLNDLSVALSCDGATAQRSGPAELAVAVTLPLAAAPGQHSCTGSLSIQLSDGSTGQLPLAFDIEVLPAAVLSVNHDDLDLGAGSLIVRADRPLTSATLSVSGESGELVQSDASAPLDSGLRLTWEPPDEEILQIHLRAVDDRGFSSALDLYPWSYSVPHEDVVFASGRAEITDAEATKLEAAWLTVTDIVQRYGKVAPVNLYVAGYTDTVGSATSNQRLSEARARGIAAWFRKRGFIGAIHYQGLGEHGLIVPTPDETDELANRRADYIVAAEAPPISEHLPQAAWTQL